MVLPDELRGVFAASPFVREPGVEPVAVQPGHERVRVMQASATLAAIPKDD